MASKRVTNLLELFPPDFGGVTMGDVEEEFKRVKKAYFGAILRSHPDKGGDASAFRDIQAAFVVLRGMYDKKKVTTFQAKKDFQSTETNFDKVRVDLDDLPTPSWEFYAEAAGEAVPTYRVELAKSNRSKCVQKGAAKKCGTGAEDIAKGEVRVGSLHEETGSYTRWNHLGCWRVPSKVWMGLPDPETCQDPLTFVAALEAMNSVLFNGLPELDEARKLELVRHAMDKSNWARRTKKSDTTLQQQQQVAEESKVPLREDQTQSAAAQALVTTKQQKQEWEYPVAGVDGAVAGALAGKTVVVTGIFPELGGGAGLELGKAKAKDLLTRFGARVTSAISGKTTALLVGKEPGFRKVSDARDKNIPLLGLDDLKSVIQQKVLMNDVGPLVVTDFSAGFRNNSAANNASAIEMDHARGLAAPRLPPAPPVPVPQKKKATGGKTTKRTARADDDQDDQDDDQDDQDEREPKPTKKKTKKATTKASNAPPPAAAAAVDPPKPKKKPAAKRAKKEPAAAAAQDDPPPQETVATTTSRSGRTTKAPSKYTPTKYATS